MSVPERRRVHRFRDHVVAGANWRPTRFVDDVPIVRVCGLCGMIPKRTVVLPCSHVLCQFCQADNSQDGSGLCPIDEKPFEETGMRRGRVSREGSEQFQGEEKKRFLSFFPNVRHSHYLHRRLSASLNVAILLLPM
ncbi:hypothetical protein HPB49_022980 [Dermacentor silvarum]|uniref:Uncharacterized protein n=1 Tax=Dermacentor silvarum TaxID=543639 RepID=A0ACB8DRP7_DERSI|nr:hypothetical protein HPB49_022980 [Dermacentor silvarum]